jgi:phytoene dehydrogenase-like protein
MTSYEAVVVGSGPNGLAAAITLAQAGVRTLVIEANDTIGGGARTAELTLPGFLHDSCSAIHPLAVVSPFFRALPMKELGVEFRDAPLALAHPLDDGTAAVLDLSLDRTAAGLGVDGPAYRALMAPFVRHAAELFPEILRPLLHVPRHPFLLARLGFLAARSASGIVGRFRTAGGRALFGGCAAHSFLPLDSRGSASIGIALALAGHVAGWPCVRGGSGMITEALAAHFRALGGDIETARPVRSMRDVPEEARAVVFDLTPHQLAAIAGNDLPSRYIGKLQRFRYGPGVFKIDWALDGPIPWRGEDCRRAATVHVGGTFEQIAAHERAVWAGRSTDEPFVLVAQQSLFDETRAPEGKQTGWAYCHVPSDSTQDMTRAIENQIERFAPGFRDRILARHTMNTAQMHEHDANFVGGDISGGANDLPQLLLRPFPSFDPYATPNPRIYIGSSSTPPGGGVHGMCGYGAARSALRRLFGIWDDRRSATS